MMGNKIFKKSASIVLSISTLSLLAGASAIPMVASADTASTIAQLQASIAALQAQLTALSGGSSTSGAACSFSRNLTVGSKGDDVKCLQGYLAVSPQSGFFGPLTKAAAAKWQEANGVSPAVGYFGALSRAKYSAVAGAAPVATPVTPSTSGTPAATPAASGTLSVSGGTQPAASLFPVNSTRVPFTVVNFTAPADKDITVNSLVVQRTGLAQDTAFAGVVLLDETGAQVGISKTLNSLHQVTLSEPFVVKAGTTRTMTLGGNAETSSNSLSGQIAYLSLVTVNSSAASVVGSLPIAGAGHTVNESLTIGSVSMGRGPLDPGAAVTKKVGTTDYVFSSIKATAGSAEKVYLSSVRWYQAGSVASGDLANLKTYVDGTAYDMTVSSDGKYYTAAFGDNAGKGLLIDKGFSKELSIKGDIVGGSGRTVDFNVAKRTDLGLRGENFGYGITPPQTNSCGATSGTACFTSSEDPWYDGTVVTVSAGTMNVTASTAVPAQNVAINVANQPLGGFQVEVKGEPISVSKIIFHFYTNTSTGKSVNITNIALYDENGAIVSGPADGANDTNTVSGLVTFNDTVTFPVGTKAYTLKGKFSTTFVNNDTVQASTTPGSDWTTVKGLTTGLSITPTPSSAITANTMTVKSGALALSVSSIPIAQTVIAGANQFTFANYILDATASGEDLRLTNIPLEYNKGNGGTATDLTNCQLYDGATVITSSSINPSAAASGTSFTFSGGGLTISKGTAKTITLKCNIATGSTGKYEWGASTSANSTNWTGVSGLTSGQTISQTVTASEGQLMSGSSGGSLSVIQDSNAPNYKIVAAGQTGVELNRIKFSASNEDVDLRQLALILSSTASNTPIDLVGRQITLWTVEGVQIATAVFPTGDYATSSSITTGSFRIPKDGSKVLVVKGDIAGMSVSGPLTFSGDKLIVDYDGGNRSTTGVGNYGVGIASGSNIAGASGLNGSTGAASSGVRITKSYPTLTFQALPTSALSGGTNANNTLYRFAITANSGDVAIYKFSFLVGSSTFMATTSLYSLYAYTDSGYSNIDSNFTSGLINNSQCFNGLITTVAGPNHVVIYPDKNGCNTGTTTYSVPSGVTRYFALKATVANAYNNSTKDSFSVYMTGDSAFPTVVPGASTAASLGAINMGQAAQVNTDGQNNFIWSPISTTTQVNIADLDFTNGYQVVGLPAAGMQSVTLQIP